MKVIVNRRKISEKPRIRTLQIKTKKSIHVKKYAFHASASPLSGHRVWLSDFGRTLVFSINGSKGYYNQGEWVPCQ